jgi:hypothetical protein
MYNELEMIWKEAAVDQFDIPSWHLPGGAKGEHEDLSRNGRSPAPDFNPGPAEYEAGVLTTAPQLSVSSPRDVTK